MITYFPDLAVTVLITALLIFVLHYFPWHKLYNGRPLPRLWAYVTGVLAFALPYTVLLIYSGYIQLTIALWALILTAGIATIFCYGLDRTIDKSLDARDLEQLIDARDQHAQD